MTKRNDQQLTHNIQCWLVIEIDEECVTTSQCHPLVIFQKECGWNDAIVGLPQRHQSTNNSDSIENHCVNSAEHLNNHKHNKQRQNDSWS